MYFLVIALIRNHLRYGQAWEQVENIRQISVRIQLIFLERVIIQTRLNDKHSPNKIAAELGCSPNTVRNEIKRGTVNGKVPRYKAEAGQKAYEEKKTNPSIVSWEKGSNECYNRLVRRFIAKGERISYYRIDAIARIEAW